MFKQLIHEVNESINNVIIFNTIISSALVFFVLFLVLTIMNFYPFFALIPTIMFFIIKVYLGLSKNKAKMIEQKYPLLKEKLQTSFDARDQENPVVQELKEEVVAEMRNVRLSSFISQPKVFSRMFLIVILAFTIMTITMLNIQLFDLNKEFDKLKDNSVSFDDVFNRDGELSDIYGESGDIKTGTEKIEVQIRPIGFEVDIRQQSDIPDETFGENSFPQEVFVTGSESFVEDFSVEDSNLVKDYFQKMSKVQ